MKEETNENKNVQILVPQSTVLLFELLTVYHFKINLNNNISSFAKIKVMIQWNVIDY